MNAKSGVSRCMFFDWLGVRRYECYGGPSYHGASRIIVKCECMHLPRSLHAREMCIDHHHTLSLSLSLSLSL